MDLFLTNTHLFTSQDVNWWITCGLLWCFYQLFGLSFWRHPFTAEDPLVSMWCNAKFLQICCDEKTNSFVWPESKFSANVHFWVNCFFKNIFWFVIEIKRWTLVYWLICSVCMFLTGKISCVTFGTNNGLWFLACGSLWCYATSLQHRLTAAGRNQKLARITIQE